MTGEVLLLIPPMLCDARVFAPQIAALSGQHPILIANTRTGEAIADIAARVVAHAPPSFALAGMGMGGMIALEIFRAVPSRVTRMALIATNAQTDTPEVAAQREPLIIAARAGRMNDVLTAEMDPRYLAPTSTRQDVMVQISTMGHDMGAAAYVKQARAMQRRRDQQDVLHKIKVPALVLCGAHDGLNTVRRHEFMAQLIPGATLTIIENAGHLPTLEQPTATNAALSLWLGEPLVLR